MARSTTATATATATRHITHHGKGTGPHQARMVRVEDAALSLAQALARG